MLREGSGGRRPWKVWDTSRTRKRLILASSLDELREKGREKLGCSTSDAVRLVLESDGTHIDDGEYLKWLPDNTVFLLLRAGEPWTPQRKHHSSSSTPASGSACSSQQQLPQPPPASMSRAIPRVVCEALNLLEIRTEPPFWKLIDNRGRITLVLHWELPPNNRVRYVEPNIASAASAVPATSSTPPELRIKTVPLHPNEEVVTLVSQDGTTVTTLKTRNSVIPESARNSGASGRHPADECEFHCGSLHEEGRSIQGARSERGRSRPSSGASGGRAVRFYDAQPEASAKPAASKNRKKEMAEVEVSSESEVEPESTTVDDDSGITSEKLLMLTDQLTADQRKHLTILDLGVILERLRAKIIDVERLEREPEGPTCFRWMIKATIRGEVLRDLGVLYNGNYYSISEHPGLAYAASGFEDDDDDREDPV